MKNMKGINMLINSQTVLNKIIAVRIRAVIWLFSLTFMIFTYVIGIIGAIENSTALINP